MSFKTLGRFNLVRIISNNLDVSAPEYLLNTKNMTHILKSAKYSLAHAQRHLAVLEAELQSYFDAKPYQQTIAFDPEGQTDIHKLKLSIQLPDALSGIAFDTVSNLRAALDQAGYAVATASGGSGKQSYFPFGDTESEASSRATGASREIPASIFAAMIASKPYREGDICLWALNRLCNYNKHRFIVPTAIYSGGAYLRNAYFSSVREFSFPPRWNRETQEMVLAVVPHGAPFSMDMQIQTFVAFADVEGLPLGACSAILRQSAQSVENVLTEIEHECKVLGL